MEANKAPLTSSPPKMTYNYSKGRILPRTNEWRESSVSQLRNRKRMLLPYQDNKECTDNNKDIETTKESEHEQSTSPAKLNIPGIFSSSVSYNFHQTHLLMKQVKLMVKTKIKLQ